MQCLVMHDPAQDDGVFLRLCNGIVQLIQVIGNLVKVRMTLFLSILFWPTEKNSCEVVAQVLCLSVRLSLVPTL